MKDLLTVVMPTYNREKYIDIAIKSILEQSYYDFEFLIVDDCSSDNTEQIVKKNNDSRIKYIKLNKNKGEYWTTNYSISIAKGTYVTWVHSDDLIPKNSFELRINELLANKDLDFVHGNIERVNEFNETIEKVIATDMSKECVLNEYLKLPDERKNKYLIHHLTIMMKKDFFEKTQGMDNLLPFAGDIDWLIRAIKIGNFKKIDETLYYYRTHDGSRRVQDVKNGIDKDEVNRKIIEKYKKIWTQ